MPTRRRPPLDPRRRPRQERARATVAAILEAAARIFATHGYAAGTTNRIAEAAGVSIGSLYEYFPGKDALLVALVEQHLREGEAVLRWLTGAPRAARAPLPVVVRAFVDAMVHLHAQRPRLHRVLFEEAPLPPRVRRRLAALEQATADEIAALLRTHPDARVADPALAARVIVHTVEALTHRLVLDGTAERDVDAWSAEITRLVAGYVTGAAVTPPAAAPPRSPAR